MCNECRKLAFPFWLLTGAFLVQAVLMLIVLVMYNDIRNLFQS